jgi:hypothetical protein
MSIYAERRLGHPAWTVGGGTPPCGLTLSTGRCEAHASLGAQAPRREAVLA